MARAKNPGGGNHGGRGAVGREISYEQRSPQNELFIPQNELSSPHVTCGVKRNELRDILSEPSQFVGLESFRKRIVKVSKVLKTRDFSFDTVSEVPEIGAHVSQIDT